MKKDNIVLVGFMGTGKTTVGRVMAERLGWRHIDTDRIIETEEGMSIPDIFSGRGEPYFRRKESEVIKRVMEKKGQVISTGGGAVLAAANRERMMNNGFVAALTASLETIVRRVGKDENRPLLQGNSEERVRRLLEERKFAYDFADIKIDTSQLSVNDIVDAILEARSKLGG